MKKIIVFIFCITNLLSFGQEKTFDFGFLIGAGFSNAMVQPFKSNPNISYSVLAGGSLIYNSNSKFIFETNLSYENKGTSNKVVFTDDFGNEIEEKVLLRNFHYLTFSALPGLKFGNKTKFFFNSGLVVGVILNKQKGINTNPLKIFDLGIGLKLGIEKQFSEKIIFKIFVQDNFSVLNNLAYNKLNGYMQNAFYVGIGTYFKLGNKK